jgi:hypothetical protein
MDNIFEACSNWNSKEIEYLKLYIESRNKVKTLTADEIKSNFIYNSLIYSNDDEIEIDSP